MKKVNHNKDSQDEIKMHAELLNQLKDNIAFQISPPVKKNLITMLNINAIHVQPKEK
jgi:hypothetical protein